MRRHILGSNMVQLHYYLTSWHLSLLYHLTCYECWFICSIFVCHMKSKKLFVQKKYWKQYFEKQFNFFHKTYESDKTCLVQCFLLLLGSKYVRSFPKALNLGLQFVDFFLKKYVKSIFICRHLYTSVCL